MIGLAGSVLVFLALGGNEVLLPDFGIDPLSSSWWIYLGGTLGVGVVLLSNIVVVKISAFYLSLLIFIGQIFTGIIIDIVISGELSYRSLIGGILVATGLCINLFLDRRQRTRLSE
jgi:transporter family-2 protein